MDHAQSGGPDLEAASSHGIDIGELFDAITSLFSRHLSTSSPPLLARETRRDPGPRWFSLAKREPEYPRCPVALDALTPGLAVWAVAS
jgi:hypothetical protein